MNNLRKLTVVNNLILRIFCQNVKSPIIFRKILKNQLLLVNENRFSISTTTLNGILSKPIIREKNENNKEELSTKIIFAAGILSLFSKDEETPEDKLITVMKRGILCIQREQYDKAEQMLHLALRMAQEMKNRDGITYIYDLLANLALEQEQYEKAEKLFIEVMKRLFADGHSEDSIKILHISSKIAHISQLQGHFDKSLQGFQWTTEKIEKKLKEIQDDNELKELLGLTKNWYAQLLMEMEDFVQARKHLTEAFSIFTQFNGTENAEAVTLLNNLSVTCTKLGDMNGAKKYLEDATKIVERIPELAEAGVLKANLGLIYFKEGLIQKAKESCSYAWKLGKKYENKRAIEQADYCLNMIREYEKTAK